MPDKLRQVLNRNVARSALIFLLIFSVVFMLFFWRLGSLTPGLSPTERAAVNESLTLEKIKYNPANAPYKLLQLGLYQADSAKLTARLPSVIIGLVSLACFYIVIRRWFGRMVAVFATIIFASLPWVILTSRNASPHVMYLAVICLVAIYIWLSLTDRKSLAYMAFAAVSAVLAYTPGIVWFLLLSAMIWRRKLVENARDIRTSALIAAVLVFIAGISPLLALAFQNPDVLKSILLIPQSLPSIVVIFKSLALGLMSFVWSTSDSHPLVLGNLPLLNATALVFSIFGAYVMWDRARREFLGLLAMIVVALIGFSLNRNLGILTLAFPAVGVLIAAGLRYLYAEWRSIFPRNPLPKSLALALITSLVLLNMLYGVRYALAAWPNSVQTKNTYVLK